MNHGKLKNKQFVSLSVCRHILFLVSIRNTIFLIFRAGCRTDWIGVCIMNEKAVRWASEKFQKFSGLTYTQTGKVIHYECLRWKLIIVFVFRSLLERRWEFLVFFVRDIMLLNACLCNFHLNLRAFHLDRFAYYMGLCRASTIAH